MEHRRVSSVLAKNERGKQQIRCSLLSDMRNSCAPRDTTTDSEVFGAFDGMATKGLRHRWRVRVQRGVRDIRTSASTRVWSSCGDSAACRGVATGIPTSLVRE
ncbi:hypothetical protein EXIGLDRAFT_728137 [Exidia glandulosa HHB12029]|uniref:Uncharacterized protein n=1 Tax=Exidia glandulosa HHB12029 TaxID=1314781 RepID=A0A165LVY1_EXIGL|nr:hypothetical protein EXIGLDRAFT_728137 [Exidia glandulosa HHB12029]